MTDDPHGHGARPPPADAQSLLLDVEGLVCARGSGKDRFVLDVPRLSVGRGERLGLMGASGSGKSTLLEILGLLSIPDGIAGFSLFGADGLPTDIAAILRRRDIGALGQIRADRIGFLLQDGALLPYLDVFSNAALAVRLARPSAAISGTRIEDLAAAMGIGGLLDRLPASLSGGQMRRAAILRALAPGGDLLICDEPTTGLDDGSAGDVMDLIESCAGAVGMTVIVASHDWRLLEAHGYRILTLQKQRHSCGSFSVLAPAQAA